MPRKKEIFTIREAELIQWLSISHKRLDEIVSFFDADPNDDWDLVEGDDYQFVNKEKKLRNFSPKGAFKIASYIEKNEKRGIFYKFKEFFTKHDQKIRRSLARKLIFAELIDSGEIQVYQGVAMIHKQSLRRILETNGAKLNKTVNHLQQRTDKPLELGVDFYEDEKREFWFSESGIVMISKSMSETLTNKSRQEMCKTIAMEFPLAFKEIQENLDDDTKQKIEIEKAKKRAKTGKKFKFYRGGKLVDSIYSEWRQHKNKYGIKNKMEMSEHVQNRNLKKVCGKPLNGIDKTPLSPDSWCVR